MLLKAQDLESAISARQLVLHYQPKVKRDGGRWVAYGVLEDALAQAGQWQREGLDLNVALNLPADALRDQSFPDHFRRMLHERGVDGVRITLELTESAAMAHTLDAKDVCLRLRMSGAGLSIDDFGTGFSSLQQLYELPFSELKVDRRFVADLLHNDEAKAIVRATVSLAHALGMTACAEGVESKEAMQYIEANWLRCRAGLSRGPPHGGARGRGFRAAVEPAAGGCIRLRGRMSAAQRRAAARLISCSTGVPSKRS